MSTRTQLGIADHIVTKLGLYGTIRFARRAMRYPYNLLNRTVLLPACHALKIPTPLNEPDRTFLEQKVFPFFAKKDDVKDVLFAGVDYYTWHYDRYFDQQTFTTIDFNPELAKYGSKGQHTIGSVCELDKFYAANSFDIVFYNGLIGFGLDAEPDVKQALKQAYKVLKPGGIFILGWNDVPQYINFAVDKTPEYLKFSPLIIEGLTNGSHRVQTGSRIKHVFDFLQKD